MDKEEIIRKTEEFVKEKLEGAESGHGWQHADRVRKTALYLAEQEKADIFIVHLAALLHDIDDWKFTEPESGATGTRAARFLDSLPLTPEIRNRISEITSTLSFKGAGVDSRQKTIEGKVVQDADRLDALGALGIARAFAYGGYQQRKLYDPDIPPSNHKSFDEYKKSGSTTINHFYEKLLLLKDRMNTVSGRRIAESRHAFLTRFLEQFYREWDSLDLSDPNDK